MPDRPLPPDLPNLLRDILKRLENVERVRLALPPGASALQTFEDGDPLGDTRFLDFGAGLNATLIGDDYVRIAAASGSGGEFDAIVDGSIVATDTTLSPPVFKTSPGEAMTYLRTTLGMTDRALILVRPGTYTETANWTSPESVLLFGTGVLDNSPSEWDPATFKATNLPNVWMQNMIWRSAVGTPNETIGNALYAQGCHISFVGNGSLSFTLVRDWAMFESCQFDSMRTIAPVVHMTNCDVLARGEGPIPLATEFVATGLVIGQGVFTWACSTRTNIEVTGGTSHLGGGIGGLILTLDDSSNTKYLRFVTSGQVGGFDVTMTGTGCRHFDIRGSAFNAITTIRPNYGGIIDAVVVGKVDVTGPCSVNVVQSDLAGTSSGIFIRGETVRASIARHNDSNASGTYVSFIDADECNVEMAVESTGAGTRKPYDFDASSSNNVLVIAGRTTYPVAGTDAGTNNRVLPETAPPAGGIAPADADYLVGTANGGLSAEIVVGTTPGGELGNTWASPTVDATHSGSAHTDFIAKAFLDAKGDLVSASADNTPVILTVGTNTFVLTADSAEASGLKWVDVTTLLNPTAGWGSITNVTTDRAYDANATTTDELADVLGQLVADLISQGILDA